MVAVVSTCSRRAGTLGGRFTGTLGAVEELNRIVDGSSGSTSAKILGST